MGDKTSIEWTDATWNPVTGCTKVSQGCKNCYAERVFPRVYGKERKFTAVQCHPERLDQPLRWKKPRRIFVNSMSDLFHEAVPDEFIDRIFVTMAGAKRHTFQILTKRPARMLQWFSRRLHHGWVDGSWNTAADAERTFRQAWPNVQLGVSCEDQPTADERISQLLQTPAAVRFVSLEPLLGPIDISTYLDGGNSECSPRWCDHPFLSWVIVGGESGPNARPMHPDWVRSLRDQCVGAGVTFFFKQWGEWAPVSGRPWLMECVGKKAAGATLDGREWKQWPETRGTLATSPSHG